MDLKAVGLRIKTAREAKGLTQENLAAIVDLSSTHISVIERGMKTVRLDTFVAIASWLMLSLIPWMDWRMVYRKQSILFHRMNRKD